MGRWIEGVTAEELLRERFGAMATAGDPHCFHCGKSVDPYGSNISRKVTGWERNRGKGQGVHPIKERQLLGEFAHNVCLDIALHGGQKQAML